MGVQDKKKYKMRGGETTSLVVMGYKKKYSMDSEKIFAYVVRLEIVRLLISLTTQRKWDMYKMNVKSAFLNGDLEKEMRIEQPPSFIIEDQKGKVLQLKKSLLWSQESTKGLKF